MIHQGTVSPHVLIITVSGDFESDTRNTSKFSDTYYICSFIVSLLGHMLQAHVQVIILCMSVVLC